MVGGCVLCRALAAWRLHTIGIVEICLGINFRPVLSKSNLGYNLRYDKIIPQIVTQIVAKPPQKTQFLAEV